MSTRELQRAGILARVKAETLSLASAARMMAVSSRQAKRLYRRYREEGAAGVRHRSAGRPSNRTTAKGRIERNHGMHQDRLVKKLRRKAVADLAAANAFLEAEYWTEHNRRFTRPPTAADDFHVAVPRGLRLDQVFRLEATRTLSNDWVVRYDNRFFQLERQSPYPPARGSVVVRQAMNGQIEIRYRDRLLRATEITGSPGAAAPAPAPAPGTPKRASVTHGWPRRPSGDHPWRHDALSEVPIWQVADR